MSALDNKSLLDFECTYRYFGGILLFVYLDRPEFVSLGDDKMFESPESYVYPCVCIYSLIAFKHRNLVGVCLETFTLGNLNQYKEKSKIVENHMEKLMVKESVKFKNSY